MACLKTQCTHGRARSQGSCDCLHCRCLQSWRLPDWQEVDSLTSRPFRYHHPMLHRSTLLSFGQYGPQLQMSTFLQQPCGPPHPYHPHFQSTVLVLAALRTFPSHPRLLWFYSRCILHSWLHGSHHAITSCDPCRAVFVIISLGYGLSFFSQLGLAPASEPPVLVPWNKTLSWMPGLQFPTLEE